MSKNNIDLVKNLRARTGMSVIRCQKAIEDAAGDIEKALMILKQQGAKIAAEKKNRSVNQGLIDAYIHPNGKVGAIVEVNCETDFVAKNEEFSKLVHEIVMQIAAMNPENIEKLLKQSYIRDESLTIEELIQQMIAKTGENINIKRFERFEID